MNQKHLLPAHYEVKHKGKRKPGGQKGNQNARKHGFYSSVLTLAEICEFWNIINLETVDPEIAVLRLKLRSVLRHDPGCRRLLREASKLLEKWYSAKYRLDEPDRTCLKGVITGILDNYQPDRTADANT
ncbi:MAG: hypothetical protein V3R96_05270 [Dehalococcoidales bacterium]